VTGSTQHEERATLAGRAWAADVRSQLQQEGRRAAGGWPGTMSEARTRMASALGVATPVSPDERARLAKLLYGVAKECWLLGREPELEEE